MKAKVFRYKSDGNTVVAPYMELEPYAENVYLSLSEKNEYGNEDEDCFHVVCKIENVCFSCGQYSRRFLNGENRREEAAAYCRNWRGCPPSFASTRNTHTVTALMVQPMVSTRAMVPSSARDTLKAFSQILRMIHAV